MYDDEYGSRTAVVIVLTALGMVFLLYASSVALERYVVSNGNLTTADAAR